MASRRSLLIQQEARQQQAERELAELLASYPDACDKFTSRGGDYLPDGTRVADPGWDESCMMNAVLVAKEENGGV